MTGPTTERVVIGLDVGTSSVKAIAFGASGGMVATGIRTLGMDESIAGHAEQDPAEIIDAVGGALAECLAGCAGAPVEVVSVATAMHGLLALDADGLPLGPVLTWEDSRATEVATRWRAGDEGRRLHRLTGVPVHPMSPVVKLAWIAEQDPSRARAAAKWIDLKAWVLAGLTGRLVTDRSTAAGTGMRTIAGDAWCDEALALAGIAVERLPRVVETTDRLTFDPTAARRVGLDPGTPLVAGAADGPCANVGSGATSPGAIGLSVGTSAAARVVVAQPVVDDAGALFCYPLDATSWVVGGALSNGGNVVEWIAAALTPDLDSDGILALAASAPPGCGGLTMEPFLHPERAPEWDATRTASYQGLRAGHTRADLVRAAFEGVGRQLARIVAHLDDAVGPVTSIKATGGAFRAPLWRTVVADALGREIDVVADVGGTAFGAACLGLVGTGRADDLADARRMLSPRPSTVS